VSRSLFLALILAVAPAARADDTGASAAIAYGLLGIAGAIFDVGFTIHDGAHLASGEPVPKATGLIETVGALPQVAVAVYVAGRQGAPDGVRPLAIAWAVWATALTAHGVWTQLRPEAPQGRIEIGVRALEEHCAPGRPLLWTATGRF